MSSRLLTLKEACERLRRSDRSVRQLCADRRIDFIRQGRAIYIEERAIEEYLERCRVPVKGVRRVEPIPSAPPDSDYLEEICRKHGV